MHNGLILTDEMKRSGIESWTQPTESSSPVLHWRVSERSRPCGARATPGRSWRSRAKGIGP